ncbi:hypothetical protein QUC31_011946 [Theobroma cacao]
MSLSTNVLMKMDFRKYENVDMKKIEESVVVSPMEEEVKADILELTCAGLDSDADGFQRV